MLQLDNVVLNVQFKKSCFGLPSSLTKAKTGIRLDVSSKIFALVSVIQQENVPVKNSILNSGLPQCFTVQ